MKQIEMKKMNEQQRIDTGNQVHIENLHIDAQSVVDNNCFVNFRTIQWK